MRQYSVCLIQTKDKLSFFKIGYSPGKLHFTKMQLLITTILTLVSWVTTESIFSQDTNTSSCSSFSVGSCYPDQEEVIDTFPLPPNLDAGPALCQDICGVVEGCQYFSYSFSSGSCDLYHYRYLASCQVVGGPDYPSLDDCLDIVDTCDSFIQEDCSYTADIVLERLSVTNTHHCQDTGGCAGG